MSGKTTKCNIKNRLKKRRKILNLHSVKYTSGIVQIMKIGTDRCKSPVKQCNIAQKSKPIKINPFETPSFSSESVLGTSLLIINQNF